MAENCDTLLLQKKADGTKHVAKCYPEGGISLESSGAGLVSKIDSCCIPHYEDEYQNEGTSDSLGAHCSGLCDGFLFRVNKGSNMRIGVQPAHILWKPGYIPRWSLFAFGEGPDALQAVFFGP